MHTLCSRILYAVLSIIFLLSFSNAYPQNFAWAKTSGGINATVRPPFWYPTLGLDAAGNVYQGISLSGTADFNPGSPVFNLSSSNGTSVIQKLDANGNFVWARQIAATLTSLATDAEGYSYITGHFTGTADMDPGAGTTNLTSAGYADIFILKLDAAGNFVWAKQIEGAGAETANGLTLDAGKNIYIAGNFGQGPGTSTSADFDPDPVNAYPVTSAGNRDAFVLTLDASGNFIKVKTWGGSSFDNAGTAMADASGNIYVFGTFTGTVIFDPSNTLSSVNQSWIILKIDAAGNYSWIRNLGTIVQIFSMSVDGPGNFYISGNFSGTNDFDPGTAVVNYTATTNQDGFYSKFTTDGNLVYAKHIRSNGTPNAITNDAAGNLYITGSFTGSNIDFNPGSGTANLKAAGRGMYILQLNAQGNFNWVKQVGGEARTTTHGRWISVHSSGNIYSSLEFNGTIDADPGSPKFTIKSLGTDLAIHKLTVPAAPFAPPVSGKIFNVSKVAVYPNPVRDLAILEIHLKAAGQLVYNISDANGKIVMSRSLNLHAGNSKLPINFSSLPAGSYIVRVSSGEFVESIKLVKP